MILFVYLREMLTLQREKCCFSPLPFMLPSTVIPPSLCLVSGHYFQGRWTQSYLKMHLGVEWIKQPPFQSFMLALPPLTARKSSWLLFHITAAALFPLSVSCQPGSQEGAKAKQRDNYISDLFKEQSWNWFMCCEGVNQACENLGGNTATFLAQSIQQSFVSEKRYVKLTMLCSFWVCWAMLHMLCSLGGSFEAPRLDFQKFSILWLNH